MLEAVALYLCKAIDGDTITCSGGRYRLLAIDAPEMPGHCRRGRACVPGDPWASLASLRAGMAMGPIRIVVTGRDRYGRTVGMVMAGRVNLSCWQMAARQAVYWRRYDQGGMVAAACLSSGGGRGRLGA